jgi:hypothetical protein
MRFWSEIGRRHRRVAATEADHHMKCPGCSQWFDVRDHAHVMAHIHDQEIELNKQAASD